MAWRYDSVPIPQGPPCFESRALWLSFIDSAASFQRVGHAGPFIITKGEPVRFNFRFNFCADCAYTVQELEGLQERNRCQPRWLRDMVEKAAG